MSIYRKASLAGYRLLIKRALRIKGFGFAHNSEHGRERSVCISSRISFIRCHGIVVSSDSTATCMKRKIKSETGNNSLKSSKI